MVCYMVDGHEHTLWEQAGRYVDYKTDCVQQLYDGEAGKSDWAKIDN